MTVSNPIRFIDLAGLNAAPNDEFQALQQDFNSLLVNLPQTYADINHGHSGLASAGHGHSNYASTSHAHTIALWQNEGGILRLFVYGNTDNTFGHYVLTCDPRSRYFHWSNPYFAVRVDNTWVYITTTASDERIKKNIVVRDSEQDSKACLDALSAVKLIEFDWDTEASTIVDDGHVDRGFSAHNLKSINPDFVIQPTTEDIAQINISAVLPYLVGAIQGLQNEVESLKTALGR